MGSNGGARIQSREGGENFWELSQIGIWDLRVRRGADEEWRRLPAQVAALMAGNWARQTAESERESVWAVGWVERESASEEESKARLESREAEIRENEWANLKKKTYKAPQKESNES